MSSCEELERGREGTGKDLLIPNGREALLCSGHERLIARGGPRCVGALPASNGPPTFT